MKIIFLMIKLISLSIFLSLGGCIHIPKPIFYPKPIFLKLPEKPLVDKVSYDDLKCLSSDTLSTLLRRDKDIKEYVMKLESLIEANNNESKM